MTVLAVGMLTLATMSMPVAMASTMRMCAVAQHDGLDRFLGDIHRGENEEERLGKVEKSHEARCPTTMLALRFLRVLEPDSLPVWPPCAPPTIAFPYRPQSNTRSVKHAQIPDSCQTSPSAQLSLDPQSCANEELDDCEREVELRPWVKPFSR